jgi:hypothetical protein
VSFAIINGKIYGTQASGAADTGDQDILGTVYENGIAQAYKTMGPHISFVWAIDIEFKSDTFTMRGHSACGFTSVWTGRRTGPVPSWSAIAGRIHTSQKDQPSR